MRIVKKTGRSSFSDPIIDKNLKSKDIKLLKIYNNLNNLNKTVLTCSRQSLSRIIHYNNIYKKILNKPGVIMEFGVEYGSTLSLLIKLRGMYEPYNYSRKIIGFDTFSGFGNDLTQYEKKLGWKKNDYSTYKNYEKFLDELLLLEEKNSALSHIKKFELIKGNASTTVKNYLKKNQQTLISMAIFDMDLYKPTKKVLIEIKKRLFKGSILVFDEVNHPDFMGETVALLETMNLGKLKLRSSLGETFASYVILD